MKHTILVVLDVSPEDTNKVVQAVRERMDRLVDEAAFMSQKDELVLSVEAVKETKVGVHYFPYAGLGDEGRKVQDDAVVSGDSYRECLEKLVEAINNEDIDDINNELVILHP